MMRYVVLALGCALEIIWAINALKGYFKYKEDLKKVEARILQEADPSTAYITFVGAHIITGAVGFIIACILWW